MKRFFDYIGPAGLISFLSLAAGWWAIIFLFRERPFLAIYVAIGAFFLDSLDGYMARKTRTESDFGRLLDTMIDLLNYSLFAALLVVIYVVPNILGITLGFIILATGAFRLVRLNIEGFVEKGSKKYYSGLVVCFIPFVTTLLFLSQQLWPGVSASTALLILLPMSLLQVSRIPIKKTGTYPLWLVLALLLLALTLYIDLWKT